MEVETTHLSHIHFINTFHKAIQLWKQVYMEFQCSIWVEKIMQLECDNFLSTNSLNYNPYVF